jgi:hypothetical protein
MIWKRALIFLLVLAALVTVSPMVSMTEGGGGCPDEVLDINQGACAPVVYPAVVFSPVIRTVACEMWHQPSCAVDTLLPTWYDGLLNLCNVVILLGLATVAGLLTRRFARTRFLSTNVK